MWNTKEREAGEKGKKRESRAKKLLKKREKDWIIMSFCLEKLLTRLLVIYVHIDP